MDGTLEKVNEALPRPPLTPWLPPQANDVVPPVAPPLPLPAMVRQRSERIGRRLRVAAFVCGLGGPGLFFGSLVVAADNDFDAGWWDTVFWLSPVSALFAIGLGIAGRDATRTGRYRRLAVVGIVLGTIFLAFWIWMIYSVMTFPSD